jgi:hypothetical protein
MITLTREEAQQVLDALEAEHSAIYGTIQTARAIETLRARLAQPEKEQEPVAWIKANDYKIVNADLDSYSGVTYSTPEGIAVFSSDVVKWLLENKAGLYWEENHGN